MLFWIVKNVFFHDSFLCSIVHHFFFWRIILSFFFSFFIVLISSSYIILKLCNFCMFQTIRDNGPKSHLLKKGTPTMGGLIILISVFIAIIICADLSNWYVRYVLLILFLYGVLGLIDDVLKIKKNNTDGLSILYKYFWQSLIALILIVTMFIINKDILSMQLVLPFVTNITPELGIFLYILLAYFVIVGTSNAVNLSDGLDGLIIVPIMFIALGLALVAYATNNKYFSSYLHIPYIYNSGELIIVCVSIIGASLGFLWFNSYPARIFMGDVGSLPLGGALGIIAVFLRQEFLLFIMSGLFVIEVISVFLQVSYFKLYGRRVFKMTPIHHHFELQGSPEPRIVVRSWIISLILVIFGLVILAIRL